MSAQSVETPNSLSPLTCVHAVIREIPHISTLLHVRMVIEEYLDVSSNWTIVKAREYGFAHLLRSELLMPYEDYSFLNDAYYYLMLIRNAIRFAIKRDDLEDLKQILRKVAVEDDDMKKIILTNLIEDTMERGHISIITRLKEHYTRESDRNTTIFVATNNSDHLHVPQWLGNTIQDHGQLICQYAQVVKSAADRSSSTKRRPSGTCIPSTSNDKSVSMSHQNPSNTLMKLTYDQDTQQITDKDFVWAVETGQLHILQRLYFYCSPSSTTRRWIQSVVNRAARDNQFEMLLFLHERDIEVSPHNQSTYFTPRTLEYVEDGRDALIIQWLHQRYPYIVRTLTHKKSISDELSEWYERVAIKCCCLYWVVVKLWCTICYQDI